MSSMLQLTKIELDSHNALSPILSAHIQSVIAAIPDPRVPLPMKATIAATQLITFASQFRRNILLWDGTEVPINAISFVIAGSGAGKDSSVHAARKCFKPGYDVILEARRQSEVQRAIKRAVLEGEDESAASAPEIYNKYIRPLPPVDIAPTTGPGLIQHINDISELDTTSGLMYAGEFSDELAYNQDMTENIKVLSEVYDIGSREMKYTKGVEHRSKAINGQAVSALFIGSPGHILYDESVKKKFQVAFMSKLARRSFFCYTPNMLPAANFNSTDELFEHRQTLDRQALAARDAMTTHINSVTTFGLKSAGTNLGIDESVYRLFEIYKQYNSDLAESSLNPDSTSALIRRHLQWKAIKLAGALAIFDLSNSVELRHYIDAIRFCELLDSDMSIFESDLNKAPHERFSDYIRTLVQSDGRAVINVHDLKKSNFISTVSMPKLQELVHLCSGYDTSGVYSIINEGGAIAYEPIIKTESIGISYKPINTTALNAAVISGSYDDIRNAKHNISVTTAYGYEVSDTTFADLANLLEGDYAYSPFRFKNGVRGKDNILGGTSWLVLDVDSSPISASETHFMLSDINHHIALSSDPSNDYKFRVLIELDANVELSPVAWKHFTAEIADNLGIRIDPLPQSQIYFSYADRPVLSNLDTTPLEARPYIIHAKEREAVKEHKAAITTSSQRQALLADPLTTFGFLFDARNGEGSRAMIRAAYYAKDLGATLAQTLELLNDANSYWDMPMPTDRFTRIIGQVERLF